MIQKRNALSSPPNYSARDLDRNNIYPVDPNGIYCVLPFLLYLSHLINNEAILNPWNTLAHKFNLSFTLCQHSCWASPSHGNCFYPSDTTRVWRQEEWLGKLSDSRRCMSWQLLPRSFQTISHFFCRNFPKSLEGILADSISDHSSMTWTFSSSSAASPGCPKISSSGIHFLAFYCWNFISLTQSLS